MPDKVLVTGVSGFLGGHVALALLDAGYEVRGSLRDLRRADKVRAALKKASASGNVDGLEFVALDLMRDDGWLAAMKGCRYLQHVASPFVISMPADKDELIAPAVEGTRRALMAALTAGVDRIVVTSSLAAVMYGHEPGRTAPFTEADWSRTTGPDVSAYTESKTRAELEAWSIIETAGKRHELVTVNPSLITGPLLDDDPGTSGQLLQRLLRGAVPVAPRISIGIIDVRDVAELQLKAMETPSAGGHRFLASAGNLSILEAANVLRKALPAYAAKLPRFEAPDWAVRLAGLFDKDIHSQTGSLGIVRNVDSAPAQALLGYKFIAPPEALAAMAQSLVTQGLI
jgi:nucleoside-diphosphate-sugar epimerase